MEARELRGLQIAATLKVTRQGSAWVVPSQSSSKKYTVNLNSDPPSCTCPDFESRGLKCKHIYAVEYTTWHEQSGEPIPVIAKPVKPTYKQDWPAYNQAQKEEKKLFQRLLSELCRGVGGPAQNMGRPRLPLEDVLFSAAFKIYSTVSTRRFMTDLEEACAKGHISKVPCTSSIWTYLEMDMLTPYLKMLIEESALPLRAVETAFAVDSSGFSTCRFVQWLHAKYSNPQLIDKREWVKCHLICGVKTNVVTSAEITDRHAGDSPQFKALVEATAQNFAINEISADKAYLSSDNLRAVINVQGLPYIPFKSNSRPDNRSKDSLWKYLYHFYNCNQDWFLQHYHKRSNVESTFSMIKAKFGDALRSKTDRAQINEALCKVLCHNICCLIQSMFELGIQPDFQTEPE